MVGGFGLVDVPVIGDLTTGRVKTYAAEQVKIATAAAKAVCDGKLEKMVSGYELAAAKAETAEMERQRNASAQASEEHRKRLAAAESAEQSAKDTLENEIRSYELQLSEKNRACAVTAADRDWLLRH
ncbi:hypothetical protein ACC696_16715 [Rhizobium ruizarguesonis]